MLLERLQTFLEFCEGSNAEESQELQGPVLRMPVASFCEENHSHL